MHTTDSRSVYQSGAVTTAGPAQLVLMLYDGALSSVRQAGAVLAEPGGGDRIARAHRELGRAQDIITELSVTLDRAQGGAIASGLARLYDFCLERLLEANLSKDPAGLAAVTSVLSQLRDTWAEACCGVTAGVS
jgi:flagellar protein FliS